MKRPDSSDTFETAIQQYRILLQDIKRRAVLGESFVIQVEKSLRQIAESRELLSKMEKLKP